MSNKLKVAILFSGQPRFLEGKAYRSIKKNLLDIYDCTIYCHYWYDDDPMITADWYNNYPNFTCKKDTHDIIKKIYNPKKIRYDTPIEKNSIPKEHYLLNQNNPKSAYCIHSYYKSLKYSAELLEEDGEEYDFYIKLRYDNIIEFFPDLKNLIKDFLYVENYHGKYSGKITSHIFITTNKTCFLKIMKIYDNLNYIAYIDNNFIDENLFYKHIIICNNIPIIYLNRDILMANLPFNYNLNMD